LHKAPRIRFICRDDGIAARRAAVVRCAFDLDVGKGGEVAADRVGDGAEGVLERWWEGWMGWFGWCAVGCGWCDACWGAGFGGVLEDGDEEFNKEGGGKRRNAWTGDGALLVKGGVAERLCTVLVTLRQGMG
jgi:hypothetical protein